jgi:5-methyltetrahydrofolate--homocysteine methyltransferase
MRGMLDGVCHDQILEFVLPEPDISRVPIMIDSSKWEIMKLDLKLARKKCGKFDFFKEGEAFIHHAKLIKRYGAAVIIMAFDEVGQSEYYERRVEICQHSYDILSR